MHDSTRVPRIGFLFLGHIHQVFHMASIAFELGRMGRAEVWLFTASGEVSTLLGDIAGRFPGTAARIETLRPSVPQRVVTALKRRPYPRWRYIMRRHERRLLDFDVIVSPDFYSIRLIRRRRGGRPLFVRVFHGAGDRDYGPDERLLFFDQVLLPGRKLARRLETLDILPGVRSAIIGSPKLDVVGNGDPADPPRIFPARRPTVLYAPHFVEDLSSWFPWGLEILEMFHRLDRYNLIFAPHIMLFAKRNPRRAIPARYHEAPHIHIDTGSLASVDMTYTRMADVYLGDVSSQVYEFVLRPRPCVFLNPHSVAWRDDPSFLFWRMGTVITRLSALEKVFETPPVLSESDREIQRELAAEALDRDPRRNAGSRGAEAILDLVGQLTEAGDQAGISANWSS